MNIYPPACFAIAVLFVVCIAGCTGIPGVPADLKYRLVPGENLSYTVTTTDTAKNLTTSQNLTMAVIAVNGENITLALSKGTPFLNGTNRTPVRIVMDSCGRAGGFPADEQVATGLANLPNTLVFSEKPVTAGESWNHSVSYNGTMNASGTPVEYRYSAEHTYLLKGNSTVRTETGSTDLYLVYHTGKSQMTMLVPHENTTATMRIVNSFAGTSRISADAGYLVSSDYDIRTDVIIDSSAMSKDPLGVTMAGVTSHSLVSTVLVR